MRVVCDTNVLVSGILFRGPPRHILTMSARGSVTNCTSAALLGEVENVLLRPKFGMDPREVSYIIALFRDTFEVVYPSIQVNAITDDPADNIVLEAADAAAADLIISGDRHLLNMKEWKGIRIVSPRLFVSG